MYGIHSTYSAHKAEIAYVAEIAYIAYIAYVAYVSGDPDEKGYAAMELQTMALDSLLTKPLCY